MKAYLATVAPDNTLLESVEAIKLIVAADNANEAREIIQASHFVTSGQHIHIDREVTDPVILEKAGLEHGIVRAWHP